MEKNQAAKTVKPQESVKPYPYHSEDISFENKEAGILLIEQPFSPIALSDVGLQSSTLNSSSLQKENYYSCYKAD
jgi:hypothetical protein